MICDRAESVRGSEKTQAICKWDFEQMCEAMSVSKSIHGAQNNVGISGEENRCQDKNG